MCLNRTKRKKKKDGTYLPNDTDICKQFESTTLGHTNDPTVHINDIIVNINDSGAYINNLVLHVKDPMVHINDIAVHIMDFVVYSSTLLSIVNP